MSGPLVRPQEEEGEGEGEGKGRTGAGDRRPGQEGGDHYYDHKFYDMI